MTPDPGDMSTGQVQSGGRGLEQSGDKETETSKQMKVSHGATALEPRPEGTQSNLGKCGMMGKQTANNTCSTKSVKGGERREGSRLVL